MAKEAKTEKEAKTYKVVVMPRAAKETKYTQDGRVLLKISEKVPSYNDTGDLTTSDLIGVNVETAMKTLLKVKTLRKAMSLGSEFLPILLNNALMGVEVEITRQEIEKGEDYKGVVFEDNEFVTTDFKVLKPEDVEEEVTAELYQTLMAAKSAKEAAKEAAKDTAKNSIW